MARVEGGAAAAAQAAVQRWAAEALPPLLQPMQEAVGATAELASSVAAEAGGLAASLQQLAERAGCLEAAHENHEQRLGLAEARAMSGGSAGADSAAQLERLAQQVHALQAGHSQLDEAVQGLRHRAARAAGTPSPLRATASSWAPQQQPDLPDLQSLSLAAAELPAVQQQLAAVADQQAQQARTTDEVVQSGAPGAEMRGSRELYRGGAWVVHDSFLCFQCQVMPAAAAPPTTCTSCPLASCCPLAAAAAE